MAKKASSKSNQQLEKVDQQIEVEATTTDGTAGFAFSELAKETPRRMLVGKNWVGVGGEIVIPAKPPKPAFTFRAANLEEMELIHQNSPHLIIKA